MIITDPDLLRAECLPVLPEEIGSLRDQLERELKRSEELGRPGIGLSAIQIGIKKRMAIVRIPGNSAFHFDLINCRITKGFDPAACSGEGCLSVPDKYETTLRYQEIVVEDNLSEHSSFILTGLPAVVAQHEIDHWYGILLPDLANQNKLGLKLH